MDAEDRARRRIAQLIHDDCAAEPARRQPGADRGGAGPRPGAARARGRRGDDRAAARGDDGAAPGDARAGRLRDRRSAPSPARPRARVGSRSTSRSTRRRSMWPTSCCSRSPASCSPTSPATRGRAGDRRAAPRGRRRSSSRSPTTAAACPPGGAAEALSEGHIGLASVNERVRSVNGRVRLRELAGGHAGVGAAAAERRARELRLRQRGV